jgi:hypothetical protein
MGIAAIIVSVVVSLLVVGLALALEARSDTGQ